MLHKYQMQFCTSKGLAGSTECHGIPLTIAEMNRILAWWRKDGFIISHLKVWRYK